MKKFIRDQTTPIHLSAKDGIPYWQERVLLTILLAASALGFIAYIPSLYLSLKESLWVVATADTLMLIAALFLFLNPDLPYPARAWSMAASTYLLGLILIFTLGPFGAGPVWLFLFPVLTAVLLGPKASAWALAVNGISIALIGLFIQLDKAEIVAQFGFKPWHIAMENPGMKWLVISANFMLINILATVSVAIILNGLHSSLIDLTASEKRHRQIFENIMDVYFETDLDGTLLEISPSVENIFSYTAEAAKGKSLIGAYEIPEKRQEFVKQLEAEGEVFGYEITIKDKTGERITCSVNARLEKRRGNSRPKIVGILRDISEQKAVAQRQKELEERLNRSKKMEALGLLAGGVAHDLNNVLSGVVTYPDLLLMDVEKDSRLAQGLSVIQKSGLRATEIVQDLLTLSRRGVITRTPIDLNQTVEAYLRTPECEKLLAFHPNVRLETRIRAQAPLMKGSKIHLQKTVMNLIANAAEAQPGGGRIVVSTRNIRLSAPVRGYERVDPGDYILLSVEDDGEGIAPEDLKRIFEPFFTRKVMGRSGTGLGMAVVWGTVQDHAGYIDVISERGSGTRFDLYFPLTDAPMEEEAASADPATLMGRGETILIVDDEKDQREIASAALNRLGYTPVAVPCGEDAVSYFKAGGSADLILLDMIMTPGMDGFQTFRQVRKIVPELKAVIASGFSRTRQVAAALDMGAGQYIKKPYTIEKIGLALKRELSKG